MTHATLTPSSDLTSATYYAREPGDFVAAKDLLPRLWSFTDCQKTYGLTLDQFLAAVQEWDLAMLDKVMDLLDEWIVRRAEEARAMWFPGVPIPDRVD